MKERLEWLVWSFKLVYSIQNTGKHRQHTIRPPSVSGSIMQKHGAIVAIKTRKGTSNKRHYNHWNLRDGRGAGDANHAG